MTFVSGANMEEASNRTEKIMPYGYDSVHSSVKLEYWTATVVLGTVT